MAFEIQTRDEKYYVINSTTKKIRGGPYESESAAENRKDDLEDSEAIRSRFDGIEERLKRMPVVEMTAEEKAAEYDRMIAEKNRQAPHESSKDTAPPRKDEPTKDNTDVKSRRRSLYWGDANDD